MSKHTPGPWLRDTASGLSCDVRASNGRKVALCWGLSTSRAAKANSPAYRAECDANARLIAAAPELLVALQRVMDIDQPIIGTPTHAQLVEYWEYEKSQGRGEADDRLFALAAIAKATGEQT